MVRRERIFTRAYERGKKWGKKTFPRFQEKSRGNSLREEKGGKYSSDKRNPMQCFFAGLGKNKKGRGNI